MPININYDEAVVTRYIAESLSNFYQKLIININSLNIKKILRRKNPYLFRAKAMKGAAQIIEAILSAYVSSSEETIFGNEFFEPIASAVSGGNKALAEGIDIMIEKDQTIYAIAVKSGPNAFNANSKKKQEQNFMAAGKLAQQARKRFVPIVGYGYGIKRNNDKGVPKFYQELSGQSFWTELTGDSDFYIKLIRMMDKLPESYVEDFEEAYQKAANRLLNEFTNEFCFPDGGINWEKLVRYNSGN